jgi:hypothetical protein
VLQPPESVAFHNQKEWVLNAIRDHSTTFREVGATDFTFWQVRYLRHNAQENFELLLEEMNILTSAGASYCLSVYRQNKQEMIEMGTRQWSSLHQLHRP